MQFLDLSCLLSQVLVLVLYPFLQCGDGGFILAALLVQPLECLHRLGQFRCLANFDCHNHTPWVSLVALIITSFDPTGNGSAERLD